MKLTWRDVAATVLLVAIVALYVLHLAGSGGWLVSSARGTTVAVLVLGAVGCGFGRAEELYREGDHRGTAALAAWLSVLGGLALLAAVIGLVTGGDLALTLLVVCVTGLWMIATLRHAWVGAGEAERLNAWERGPDDHETVDQSRARNGGMS